MQQDDALRQLQAAAQFNAVRGSLLFHLDLAAELGRMALREQRFTGFESVVIVDGDGYGVLALDGWAGSTLIATVRFAADGRPVVAAASGSPGRSVVAMARAADALGREFSAPGHAVIVIPPSDKATSDTPLEAYALKRGGGPGDVVVGQHWIAAFSADGSTMIETVPLSRTDMVLESRPDLPPMDLELTHFGATPTEIHSYLSLRHGIALTVVTLGSSLLWRVEGERVVLVGSAPA